MNAVCQQLANQTTQTSLSLLCLLNSLLYFNLLNGFRISRTAKNLYLSEFMELAQVLN